MRIRQSCCKDASPCQDPEECLLRKQRQVFLELLLLVSPLSESDMLFLSVYFDVGSGGSSVMNNRDLAIVFGMDDPEKVPSRIALILGRLREFVRTLGYNKADLY